MLPGTETEEKKILRSPVHRDFMVALFFIVEP